ncbi:ATP-dependent DNA ligase [Pelagibacterium sp. H642]|uniref:ATP-dependent DNA ligase n=1 Tax=Pelagibacterium sp. H642 TaxID=1881069 RepID=UPI0028169732|nr:ATP-dependent DNA ligase [Pelagibacterium sp. H642]WMT92640.1 ATP-dependent DNA ligase [Pelagibacterium sp. H642]
MAKAPALTTKPMEAEPVDELPKGNGWLYEPKYDGFRCIAFRRGDTVNLQSKNQKPLERYFPEIAGAIEALPMDQVVLDGEIVIPEGFETLQLRLHPAASRIKMLSEQHPAQFIVFDLLAHESGSTMAQPLSERRAALVEFFRTIGKNKTVRIGDATTSRATAEKWLGKSGLDGIVAKRLDEPYQPGERAMRKFKLWKTLDCVVAGLYYKEGTERVDSLLLGLYDDDGKLNYVGRSRVYKDAEEIGHILKPIIGGESFTGRAPGGVSRWSGKERKPIPLKPILVAEVSADHITGDHMRHGARLLRWRSDKRPEDCTMDQIRDRRR